MIYTNPYSRLQPVDMFGAIQEAKQAKALEQQRQNTLAEQARAYAQKAKEDIIRNGQDATRALIGFKEYSPQRQQASWLKTRQYIASLVPQLESVLPTEWDPNNPNNNLELDTAIRGFSKTFFQPEQVKLGAEETLLETRPGVGPKEIARGMGKKEEFFKFERIRNQDGSETFLRTAVLPSGSKLVGNAVEDIRKPQSSMPADEYFKLYPNDWPSFVDNPYSQKEQSNSLANPPAKPSTVPGQIELPPMQFNTPSSTNRSGETNQGFPIDMSMAAPGQPTNALAAMNMPTGGMAPPVAPQMGAAPVTPPVNAMAVPFAGGMGMALPVNPQQLAESMNMLAQEQGQFAQVPNTLENVIRGDVNQAATSGYKQEATPGGYRFVGPPAPPKPENPKDRIRVATSEDLAKAGIPLDTGLTYQINTNTGEITPVERLDKLDQARKVIENAEAVAGQGTSAAEKEKAQAQARQARLLLRAMRSAQMSAIRQVVDVEDDLLGLAGNEFADTGPLDALLRFTPTATGKKLRSIDRKAAAMNNAINHAIKITGAGSQSDADVALMLNVFPDSKTDYPDNLYVIGELRKRMMDYIGLDAIVRTDNDFNALPVGTIFYDTRSQNILRKTKD